MKSLTTDVVIVGAGASGLVASLAARKLGLEVIVIESTDRVGGSTSTSSGLLWLPGNEAMKKLGVSDSAEAVTSFLDEVLGAHTPASSPERRAAFVHTAPLLARWLESSRMELTPVKGKADFFPDAPGYTKQGRALVVPPLDRRILGSWANEVREPRDEPELAISSPRSIVNSVLSVAERFSRARDNLAEDGNALVTQLLNRALAIGVSIWTNSPMVDFLAVNGAVTGVTVNREGDTIELTANNGVILASGGFEANQQEREEHLPLPTSAVWSQGCPGNTGQPLKAAMALGAATGNMSEAWWTPVMVTDGRSYEVGLACAVPHGIIVDQAGYRYVNEASSGVRVGRAMYERNRTVRAVPSYLIMDNRHRQHYQLGPWLPGSPPKHALDDGEIVRANTLNALASTLGIDQAGLIGSVVRFNGFATKGKDLDFKRGETAYERGRGDLRRRRNPNIGGIERAPYWGVPIYPGDRGTKGGLLINANSAVLREDGSLIPGLYASGGAAASLMRGTTPAAGSSLAVACVEAFRAALAVAGQLEKLDAQA